MNNHDEQFMQRCIDLGLQGLGQVAPNPLVGCVVVHEGRVIGEGWHRKYGEAHAEVNALASVKEEELLRHSTLYVNLEPCSHFGKTPPCADLLIAKKVKRVVAGMVDPNGLVAGKGIQKLRDAGIEVTCGVLEKECRALNKRFLTFIEKKRPYIILKWAQSGNGFIAPDATKMSAAEFERERHITGKVIQKLVHKWRTEESAIMVGTNTALFDNPSLNAREWPGRAPLRVVLDRTLRLPGHLKIFDKTQATWIVNESVSAIKENLQYVQVDFSGGWFSQLMNKLYEAGIQSMIVEGGSRLLTHIIEMGLWNEAIVFDTPKVIQDGIAAPLIYGDVTQQSSIDSVNITQYTNNR